MPASKKPKIRKRCHNCESSFWSNNIRRLYCSDNCNTDYNRKISPEQAEAARSRSREYYRRMSAGQKKDQKLRARYGISLGTYHQMIKDQNSRCAICKERKPLVVDHSHRTGKVRGLLCNNCNGGIGLLKDKRDTVVSALKYLDRWNS